MLLNASAQVTRLSSHCSLGQGARLPAIFSITLRLYYLIQIESSLDYPQLLTPGLAITRSVLRFSGLNTCYKSLTVLFPAYARISSPWYSYRF
jgi:hypothetical protein